MKIKEGLNDKENKKRSNNNRGRNRRGRSANERTPRKGGKGMEDSSVPVYTGSSDNDPSWYIPNGQLIKDVASIPTVFRSGAPVELNPMVPEGGYTVGVTTMNVPGIAAYYTMPMFGDSTDNFDAINTAANAFFVELRRATSGTSYYEDADAMLYLLACSNVLSAYAFVVRIYGLINYYRLENSYTPRALVEAMGVDYDDVSLHLADFRANLNKFAYRLQSIAIPKVTDYITRSVFMYENIYMDSSNNKCQYYMYSPAGFYQYVEGGPTTETAVGNLVFIPLNNFSTSVPANAPIKPIPGKLTHTELLIMLNTLLSPILESQDFGYIIADILKAMGTSNMYSVSPIAETYVNSPVYNPEVLAQMENAFVYGYNYVSAGVKQTVEINSTTLTPYFGATDSDTHNTISSIIYGDYVWKYPTLGTFFHDTVIPLNFHYDSISPENIMVASRLSSSGSMLLDFNQTPISSEALHFVDNQAKIALMPRTCGSDIVVCASMFYYNSKTGSGKQEAVSVDFKTKNLFESTSAIFLNELGNVNGLIDKMQLLSTFDWHPRMDVAYLGYTSQAITAATAYDSTVWPSGKYYKPSSNIVISPVSEGVWDLDNYALVSEFELKRMHDIAIWGLFTSKLNVIQ